LTRALISAIHAGCACAPAASPPAATCPRQVATTGVLFVLPSPAVTRISSTASPGCMKKNQPKVSPLPE